MGKPWEKDWTQPPAGGKPWERDWTAPPSSKPEEEPSDFGRGVKESFQQLPQLGFGMLAGVGATAEKVVGEGGLATGLKRAGVEGFQRWGDKIAAGARESDSWTYAYDQASEGNFGALVDWLQHGLGYVGGQGVQMLATAGIGAVGGKFIAGTAAKQIAEGMVAKEAARISAAEGGAALGAAEVAKMATANVAAKFATIGQTAAVGGMAFGQEGGEIFGDLVSENKDRPLTGAELGKAFAATLAAGGLEFVGDKIGLDLLLGRSKLLKPAEAMTGMSGRLARGAMGAAAQSPIEAATEYGQTLIEEWGKGKDPFSAESLQQAKDAAALGALGGTAIGGVGGALQGAKPKNVGDILGAGSVDEAIQNAMLALPGPKGPVISNWEVVNGVPPALPGPQGMLALPAPGASPDPAIWVDSQGNARRITPEIQGEIDQQTQAAAELGLTPDVYRAQMARNASQPVDDGRIPVGDAQELIPSGEATEVRPIPTGEASELIPTGDATELPGDIPTGQASDATVETILADDLLTNDGMPYGSKLAANMRAKREGLSTDNVVEIPGAGWVIRPPGATNDQGAVPGASGQLAGGGTAGGAQPGGSAGNVDVGGAAAPGRVGDGTAAPTPGNVPAQPVAPGGAPNGAVVPRVIGQVGTTPKNGEALELRPNADGTVTPHVGKYPLLDFDTGEPISLQASTPVPDMIRTLRERGALSGKQKFYPAAEAPGPQTAAPAAPVAPPAAPLATPPVAEATAPAPTAPAPEAAAPAAPPAPEVVPNGVKTTLKVSLGRLREYERRLRDVIAARGKGEILAMEWRDLQEDIQKSRATLKTFREMAKAKGLDPEVTIQELGGEPNLDQYAPAIPAGQARAPEPAPAPPSAPASEPAQAPEAAAAPAPAPAANDLKDGETVNYQDKTWTVRATPGENVVSLDDGQGTKKLLSKNSRAYKEIVSGRAAAPAAAPATSPAAVAAPAAPSATPPVTVPDPAILERREQREAEREIFRALAANPELVGMSARNVAVLVEAKAGGKLSTEQKDRLTRAILKDVAKRAAELNKQKHRDPAVRSAAVGEAVASQYPDADIPPQRHSAFIGGFDHALAGKTKSTLTGEHLTDMLSGYAAGRRWIEDTEEGKAWYEGRPVNKLKNTGVDLRRWFDQLRDQMKATETDIDKAFKQIERATARADLFTPLIPESASPGFKVYAENVRAGTATFKKWLESAYNWSGDGSFRSRYSKSRSNWDLIKDGERYLYGSMQQFMNDPAFRIKWMQEAAGLYLDQVREFTSFLEGASSVQEAAERFNERYILPGEGNTPARYETSAALNNMGSKLVRSARSGGEGDVWEGKSSDLAMLRSGSNWTKGLIENEQTVKMPDRATPLTAPRLDRVTRTGPDVRGGQSVTPQQMKERFGFADIGFGKWVGAQQDQDHLNYAYDALVDLAKHFKAPEKAIGFGGQLHLTIGALGRGKAAAHFSPNTPGPDGGRVQVINLTNTKGDGTVYHEWAHALDHNLKGEWRGTVRNLVLQTLKHGQLTVEQVEDTAKRFLVGGAYWTNRKNDRVGGAMYAMDRDDALRGSTAYKTNADNLGKDYWGNDEELIARAFEAWSVDTLGHTNDYLVNPEWAGDGKVTQAKGYRGTPYPTGDERKLFGTVLKALSEAIEWKDGKPVITESAFVAALPADFMDGEKLAKKLRNDRNAMEAMKQRFEQEQLELTEERERQKAEKQRAEQEEIDRLAEQKLKELQPPIVDAPPVSSTPGPLSEDDLSALFDEAAAELREAGTEQPAEELPGEPALSTGDAWTQADLDELMAALDKSGAAGIATAVKLPGIPTIHELGAMGETAMLGFGMFQTRGNAPNKDVRTPGKRWVMTWDGGGAMRQISSGKAYTLVNMQEGDRPFTISLQQAMAAVSGKPAAPTARERLAGKKEPAAATEKQTASAGKLIAEAAKLGVKGADEALTALSKLFGGTPGRLNSFPAGFDEETYQKAKPHFEASLAAFQEAGKTLKDLFKLLIQHFGDGVKVYAVRFAKDKALTANLGQHEPPESTGIAQVPVRNDALVEARKRLSVLKSLLDCVTT